jgi:hypothetical protein
MVVYNLFLLHYMKTLPCVLLFRFELNTITNSHFTKSNEVGLAKVYLLLPLLSF